MGMIIYVMICNENNCTNTVFDHCIYSDDDSSENDGINLNIFNITENELNLRRIDYWEESDEWNCDDATYKKIQTPLSIGGCTNSDYLNYNPFATFDDGTCNNNVCAY